MPLERLPLVSAVYTNNYIVEELRNHPGEPVGLGEGEKADRGGKNDAVPERGAQHFALFADQAHGGDADRDILRRDHFAGDAAGGIRGGEQNWIEMKLMSSGDLQIAEEQIARGVAAA